ncbi:hypothetical protein [Niastella yeongjuensis]|uniref:hypothetical protein n=1 Tax=Niastella yeongjuensis TaxID=354355 RepID=UPI0008CDAD07|nr:hypothetical protein [Niastella yeongjuensis]SEP49086.1 hypothetical protein SAMN05660816_06886 [Niastella yeongjuensis]
MKKHVGIFVKTSLFLSVIYIWPSCEKKDNDPAPSTNDTTKTPVDTSKGPDADSVIYKGWVVSTLAGSGAMILPGLHSAKQRPYFPLPPILQAIYMWQLTEVLS